MFYAILAAFAAVIVILDQVVKYLVVQNIPLGGMVPVWPGVIHLTYVKKHRHVLLPAGGAAVVLRGRHPGDPGGHGGRGP